LAILAQVIWPWVQPQSGSISLKFLLEATLESESFEHLTPWRLGVFGDFRKKKQQFSVALPTS